MDRFHGQASNFLFQLNLLSLGKLSEEGSFKFPLSYHLGLDSSRSTPSPSSSQCGSIQASTSKSKHLFENKTNHLPSVFCPSSNLSPFFSVALTLSPPFFTFHIFSALYFLFLSSFLFYSNLKFLLSFVNLLPFRSFLVSWSLNCRFSFFIYHEKSYLVL